MRKLKKQIVKVFLLACSTLLLAGAFGTTTEAACKHSYKVTKTVKATCKKAGYKQSKCKKCGKKKKTTIKKLSHKNKLKKTVKATCTKSGYKQYKCSKCGTTKKTTLKKLGHNYKLTKTVKATCTKSGYKQYKCSRCSTTKKTTLDKLGHSYTKKVVKPTCTQKGYTKYTCSRCGYNYKKSEVAAKGHTNVEEIITQSGENYKRVYCSVCGKEISKTLIEAGEYSNTLMNGEDFANYIDDIESDISAIIFTSEAVPNNVALTDVSAQSDGSVVSWKSGENVFIATRDGQTLYANEDCSYMFDVSIDETELVFDNFDTSRVTNMEGMFGGCYYLTTLDVSRFNTSNVTNMANMFSYIGDVENLDLRNFDTSNVTNMEGMFSDSEALKEINVSSFNTSNVTSMRHMFSGCKNLKTLDLSGFDTSNVIDMVSMFNSCTGLEELNLNGFDTSKVEDMGCMFDNCTSLKSLDISNFDTSNVKDMFEMFIGCRSLKSLDVSSFNTSNVEDMYGMFSACRSLESLDLMNFDVSKVTCMEYMFSDCDNLKYIYGTNWTEKASSSLDSAYMFTNCSSLVGVIPYKGAQAAEEYTIKNANPISGYFATYGSEGHRPNNMTDDALSMETFKNAIDELSEDYKLKWDRSFVGNGGSLHPESSSVDQYGEESVKYHISTKEANLSLDPCIMIQIVKVNDVSKADAVGQSFENWEYYSQHLHKYLLYKDGEYVIYISVPSVLSDAGVTMEKVEQYMNAYYDAATKN